MVIILHTFQCEIRQQQHHLFSLTFKENQQDNKCFSSVVNQVKPMAQKTPESDTPFQPRIVIISGGTASNSLVNTFSSLSPHISYLLPISDNGGSTSELMRVIGGPAIGDLRSRITRLIPNESTALRDLLSHRLSECREDAKQEWAEIVEGTHPRWYPVESQCRELIRPFFTHVHVELLKRSRPSREFRFESASVGNLFLTGARLFCGSLDSAIELFLRVTLVPNSIAVLPALNTNFSHHISAELENGLIITGQSQISHPSEVYFTETSSINTAFPENPHPPSVYVHPPIVDSSRSSTPVGAGGSSRYKTTHSANASPDSSDEEDAHLPFTHPDLKTSQLHFSKDLTTPLVSPIRRIFYINPYGQEIHPRASSRVIRTLEKADAIIFSIGSLFTSTVPVVILQGFASSIQDTHNLTKKRILLLNGSLDRETNGLDAIGFVRALVGACLYSEHDGNNSIYHNTTSNTSSSSLASNYQHSMSMSSSPLNPNPNPNLNASTGRLSFTAHGRRFPTSAAQSHDLALSTFPHAPGALAHSPLAKGGAATEDPYDGDKISQAQWSKYITHIVYLKGSKLMPTDAALTEFQTRGIICIGVNQELSGAREANHYAPDILQKALTTILDC